MAGYYSVPDRKTVYRDSAFPDEEQTILRKYVLELARCQLSQQKFTQPRFLHCMHCFSYKAIAPFAENGMVICPSCQFETKLGPEGLQDRSHVVPEIIDLLRSGRNWCEECLTAQASVLCLKCDAPLCTACYNITHASRLFDHHRIQSLVDGRPARPVPRDPRTDEPIKYLCTTDQALLSETAVRNSEYKDKHFVSIEEAAEQARMLISHLIQRCRERMSAILTGEDAVAGVVPRLSQEYQELVAVIEQRTEQMCNSIDQRRDTLLREANELKELKVQRLLEDKSALGVTVGDTQSALRVVLKILELANDFEIIDMKREIEVRLRALKEIPVPATGKEEDWDLSLLTSLDDVSMEVAIGNLRKDPLMQGHAAGKAMHHEGRHLFAVGGSDGYQDLQTVERYDVDNNEWLRGTPMLSRRRGLGATSVNGTLYVMGGWDGTKSLDTCEKYEHETAQWVPMASMSSKRQGMGAAVLNGKVYAVGGYDGQRNLDSVERYDPYSNQWVSVAKLNYRRRGVSVVALHGKLYAMGGYDGSRHHETVERYDPYGNKWSVIAPMAYARSSAAAAALGNKIIIAGGWDGSRALEFTEEYDPFADKWMPRAPLMHKRHGGSMGVISSQLYIAGGWDGLSSSRLAEVEQYDNSNDTWISVKALSTPRFAGVLSVV